MNIEPAKTNIEKSKELWKSAESIIPGGTQTFSKGPDQFVFGVAPIFLKRGEGSYVWDVDGNKYIDLCMGLWAITLGYGYPGVSDAISRQAKEGQTFSLMHPLEVEVAEMLLKNNTWADMVRFGKNGSDVTTGAIKVSRAYTGRELIARCSTSYHGWHDWYISTTERNKGIPSFNKELCKTFDYNDIESFKLLMDEHGKNIACVIMEGITTTFPKDGFLKNIEKITHDHGALLIFDEIINGFRLAKGGAIEYYGIDVDLACFGKGIANGSPVSVLTGKKEIMKLFNEVFFSFTFGGETIGLASTKTTLEIMKENNVVEHLEFVGDKLNIGLNERVNHFGLKEVVIQKGYPARTILQFHSPYKSNEIDLNVKSLFQQEVLKRGVLLAEYHSVCYSHTEADIDYILDVYEDALEILAEAIETDTVSARIEGIPSKPVLRRPD